MTRIELEQLLTNDFSLNTLKLNSLYTYYEMLEETSKVMNLTAITDFDGVYIKHFYDSLLLSKTIDLSNKTLIDVGSGAGFPGIVLKILEPSLDITLLEPTLKRCNFLNNVINKLQLQGIKVINDRAENYVTKARESYDIVTARAVASLNILLELCSPLAKTTGSLVLLKGPDVDLEIIDANKASKLLNLKEPQIFKFNLPIIGDERKIVIYQKKGKTNTLYPRTYAKIKNNPL